MTNFNPALTAIVLALALAAVFRGRAAGRRLLALAIASLFLWAWKPFALLLLGSLEGSYPAPGTLPGEAEAIVLLSAGSYPAGAGRPQAIPDIFTYDRAAYAAWLYHHWRPVPIVASGGAIRSDGGVV